MGRYEGTAFFLGRREDPNGSLPRYGRADRASRRVWCSHARLAPAHGNEVSTRDGLQTAPGPGKRKNSKNTAQRNSLSLDKGSPHTGSAVSGSCARLRTGEHTT